MTSTKLKLKSTSHISSIQLHRVCITIPKGRQETKWGRKDQSKTENQQGKFHNVHFDRCCLGDLPITNAFLSEWLTKQASFSSTFSIHSLQAFLANIPWLWQLQHLGVFGLHLHSFMKWPLLLSIHAGTLWEHARPHWLSKYAKRYSAILSWILDYEVRTMWNKLPSSDIWWDWNLTPSFVYICISFLLLLVSLSA